LKTGSCETLLSSLNSQLQSDRPSKLWLGGISQRILRTLMQRCSLLPPDHLSQLLNGRRSFEDNVLISMLYIPPIHHKQVKAQSELNYQRITFLNIWVLDLQNLKGLKMPVSGISPSEHTGMLSPSSWSGVNLNLMVTEIISNNCLQHYLVVPMVTSLSLIRGSEPDLHSVHKSNYQNLGGSKITKPCTLGKLWPYPDMTSASVPAKPTKCCQ
jgi:hypothetical protein